jgi:hypothetical protein
MTTNTTLSNLRAGDVVLHPTTGKPMTVLSNPVQARQKHYVHVTTDAGTIMRHKDEVYAKLAK